MKIRHCRVIRLDIPFRRKFSHATATRNSSDTLLILLTSDTGLTGMGEILARQYVTGETNDEIFNHSARQLAEHIIGKDFPNTESITHFLHEEIHTPSWGSALFGGFELALLSLCAQQFETNISTLVGKNSTTLKKRIITVGLDQPLKELQYAARQSGSIRPAVVKVKVVDKESSHRIEQVSSIFNHQMPIRLDANGCFDQNEASQLLADCQHLPLQSFEQPFDKDKENLVDHLISLYDEYKIPLIADESICNLQDLESWITSGGYQGINIRVGKAGGLLASRKMIELANDNNLSVVAGTMVGESPILNQASEILLRQSEELSYVEGLGQSRWLLSACPVRKASSTLNNFVIFNLVDEIVSKYCVGDYTIA